MGLVGTLAGYLLGRSHQRRVYQEQALQKIVGKIDSLLGEFYGDGIDEFTLKWNRKIVDELKHDVSYIQQSEKRIWKKIKSDWSVIHNDGKFIDDDSYATRGMWMAGRELQESLVSMKGEILKF